MYDKLAKRIPDKVRSERLMIAADPIANAQAVSMNSHMQLLFGIYTEFVFPNAFEPEDLNCPKCLMRIRNSFNEMLPYLVTLEKEYKLLKSIK